MTQSCCTRARQIETNLFCVSNGSDVGCYAALRPINTKSEIFEHTVFTIIAVVQASRCHTTIHSCHGTGELILIHNLIAAEKEHHEAVDVNHFAHYRVVNEHKKPVPTLSLPILSSYQTRSKHQTPFTLRSSHIPKTNTQTSLLTSSSILHQKLHIQNGERYRSRSYPPSLVSLFWCHGPNDG